jgi:hypothetical protein
LNDPKYLDIIEQYHDIIDTMPKESDEKEKKLKDLDTQLAERMILDSGNMIEFSPNDMFADGKTPEQESKKAYEELSHLPEYKDKIERAVKLL